MMCYDLIDQDRGANFNLSNKRAAEPWNISLDICIGVPYVDFWKSKLNMAIKLGKKYFLAVFLVIGNIIVFNC